MSTTDQRVTVILESDASTVPLADVAFHFRLNQIGKWTPMHEQQHRELVPIHGTGQELRMFQYWPICIVSPIERPRHRHRKEANLRHPHHRPEIKPRPLRLYVCLLNSSALDGEARM